MAKDQTGLVLRPPRYFRRILTSSHAWLALWGFEHIRGYCLLGVTCGCRLRPPWLIYILSTTHSTRHRQSTPAMPDINTLTSKCCTFTQALELPETESQGGLLGLTRQDLYLAMRHQTSDGNNQDHKTSVREGVDGMVEWRGETISIKYDGLEETVIAEVGCVAVVSSPKG